MPQSVFNECTGALPSSNKDKVWSPKDEPFDEDECSSSFELDELAVVESAILLRNKA